MKRVFLLIAMVVALVLPLGCFAAEVSSDRMLLDWKTEKVWLSGGNLCATGTFSNQKSDIIITRINDFTLTLYYVDENGEDRSYTVKPQRIPRCKINGGESRKVIMNFGPFTGQIKKWHTMQEYEFTYMNGASW